MAKVVRDAAGNIVTDPAILSQVLGPDYDKPVKIPETVDVTPAPSIQAEDEATTEESFGGKAVKFARDVLSGEAIAKIPEAVGLKQPQTGQEKTRGLEEARRFRGQTPEYRQLGTTGLQGGLQLASNVAADAIGMLAGKVALPIEVGIQQARAGAEVGAGVLTDTAVKLRKFGLESPSNYLFGELASKALEKEQMRGKYRTADALERRAQGFGEFVKGAAFGLSPAIYAAAEANARNEPVADAAWETFLAYPLASIVPLTHVARASMLGNKPAIKNGEQLRTIRGEPVNVNAFGQKVIEKAGPLTQRLMFDVVPSERVKQLRTTAAASEAMRKPSPAAQNLSESIRQYNVLRDLEIELADPQFAGATEAQKWQAVEGTIGDVTSMGAPVLDRTSRDVAQAVGEQLVTDGMAPDVAQQAIPYIIFEGVRATKSGVLSNPLDALGALGTRLASMDQQSRAQYVKSFEQVVKSKMNDPTFLAAADQTWSSPQGDYQWIPRSEVRQRAGFVEAYNRIKAAEQANGKRTFELSIPELGELRKDYVYDLYNKMVDDLRSTPEGRERVLNLLRANPLARLAANPSASPEIKALVAYANQPAGTRRKFMDAINRSSLEISENLGVDPAVVAKHYDRYLSRSFEDSLRGNDMLESMLDSMDNNPAFAALTGQQRTSGRFKRKLSEGDAAQRFMQKVQTGEVSLQSALATTAANMIALSQHLYAMSEIESTLRQNGQLFDPDPATGKAPRAGLVATGSERVAGKSNRASGDPYNFALGKMANKYVDPAIAKALGLHVEAVAKVHPLLQTWRWLKTVANVPKYQVTQLINDNMQMWAITGESRFTPRGRPIALKAQGAIDRFAASMAQPGPKRTVMSPEMLKMQDYGIANYDGIAMEIDSLPPSVRGWVTKQAMTLSGQVIKAADPADALGALAQSVAYTKVAAKMPKEVIDAVMAMPEAYKNADVTDTTNPLGRTYVRTTSALAAAHDVLSNSVLSVATAMAEQQRRLQAFMFGKELLGLTDEQAAVLTSEAVYGVEPQSTAMQRMTTNPIYQVFGPQFINFGVWQLKKATQRALNDKALWIGHALEQGIRAYEEEAQDDPGDEYWKARVADAMLRHTVAPDVGLSNADDIAGALKVMGLPENYVNMVRGDKGRNPYITWNLRDVGGYQSLFSSLNFDHRGPFAGVMTALSFSPIAQTAAQILDPQAANPYRFDTGVPLGSMDAAASIATKIEMGLNFFAPTALNKAVATGADAAKMMKGEQPTKFGGTPKNPIEAATSMWGPFALNAIDRIDTLDRMSRRIKYYRGIMRASAARDKTTLAKIQIPDEVKMALIGKTTTNALALQKQMELGFAWAYNGMSFKEYRQAALRIEQIRKEAVDKAEKGAPNGAILAKWAYMGELAKYIAFGQTLLSIGALAPDPPEKGAEP